MSTRPEHPLAALVAAMVVLLLGTPTAAPAESGRGGGPLVTYETRYYTIHTDLPPDLAREAILRTTRMAEEYRRRTAGFYGRADMKLPFYLYRSEADYVAAGAPSGSAGVFTGDKLMAHVVGDAPDLSTWHTVQHEGFHQFAHFVIGYNLPTWLNEGLAEYFGEGLFTGDGFVTGVIPPWRLERLQASIRRDQLLPMAEMMRLPLERWNAQLSVRNYDQAWSLVHFLNHADGGRYKAPFDQFVRDVGRGRPADGAWRDAFGRVDLEPRYKAWWLAQRPDATAHLYGQANVAILTSFLARAHARRQAFDTFEQFRRAAEAGQLAAHREDWLPPALLEEGLALAEKLEGKWALETPGKGRPPTLILTLPDGTTIRGRFTVRAGRVLSVVAQVGP